MKVRLKIVYWMVAVAVCGFVFFCGLCVEKRSRFTEEYKKHLSALKLCESNIQVLQRKIRDSLISRARNKYPPSKYPSVSDNSTTSVIVDYENMIFELTRELNIEKKFTKYYDNARKFPWLY